MNFLGMGPAELVLVAALALIVFGPDKLPDIARQIGRAVGELRRVSSDVTREVQRSIQEEPSASGPRIVRQPPSSPQQTPVEAAVPDTPSILPPATLPVPTSASTEGSWEDGATQPTPPDRSQDPRRPV